MRSFSTDLSLGAQYTNKIQIKPGGRASVSGLTVTICGASGFIGGHVLNQFAQFGSQIIAPYRGDGSKSRHLKVLGDLGQIVLLPMDLAKPDTIRRAVEKSHVVINLIGRNYETANYTFHDVHCKIAHRLAKVAKEAGVPRFVQVGSVAASASSSSSWLASKALAEQAVQDYYPDATIFRLPPVFGLEDYFMNRYGAMLKLASVIPMVDGGVQKLQPTAVQDVARAIVHAVGTPLSIGQTYELGGPEVMTQRELLSWIAKRLYIEEVALPLPFPVARMAGRVMDKLPFNFRPLSADMVEMMRTDLVADASMPGYAALNIKPKTLNQAGGTVLVPYLSERGPVRNDLGLKVTREDVQETGLSDPLPEHNPHVKHI